MYAMYIMDMAILCTVAFCAARLQIIVNPPFVGQALRTKEQSDDMSLLFGKGEPETKLDYVLGWYKKAVDYMKSVRDRRIKTAFVSTNSICQGEPVPTFWKHMFDEGLDIGFAYTSFVWKSESTDNAAVVCIIVGFSIGEYDGQKIIFTDKMKTRATHINAYLHDANDIWITSRKNIPPTGFPKMIKGSEPTDGGNLFLTPDEAKSMVTRYPVLRKYVKPFVGGDEFLNNKQGTFSRYCFWFEGGNPADYIHIKEISERLERIMKKRALSNADRIRKMANYPYLFSQNRQPKTDYLLIPRHSTSSRKYIPFGFMEPNVIVGDACCFIPDASLYLFGILTSNVHMAWVSLTCGRLANAYRYSNAVYNNFPMPTPTDSQRMAIEKTAQAILDARCSYLDCSLDVLYNELGMPPELRTAHQQNDLAVWDAYGRAWSKGRESECVAYLMKLYQAMTAAEGGKK